MNASTMTEDNQPLTTTRLYAGELLTIGQVSKLLKVDSATVRKWCATGALESIDLPTRPGSTRKHRRIKGETVDRILGNT